jgi:uncharacterized protein
VKKRVCIVGGGVAGLGAAWALNRHPDKFDFVVMEKNQRLGGNAMTVDIPQDDGTTIPIDVSVTACIPTVYHNYIELMKLIGVELVPTKFSYTVNHGGEIYAHDYDSPMRRRLQPEIDKFQQALRFMQRFNELNKTKSKALSFLNPFNYISMGQVLNALQLSGDFRFKVLKPMFVNFLMATNVFDMPASLFSRYLDFFDIEKATAMTTWNQGTRNIYQRMTADFQDRIFLGRGVAKIRRDAAGVTVRDDKGVEERFDEVILACNANQALMMVEEPSRLELYLLSSIRYEAELHNHAIIHTDGSVVPDNETKPLETRSNYIEQYGARPDNYEITYIMHNQQPWAKRSDKPCLVTYNPQRKIDESKIVARWWFQHVVHDVHQTVVLMNLFPFVQGKNHTYYCGAHTLINAQETCFVSGLAAARQLGADYPFEADEAREWFNFYGSLLHGGSFRKAKAGEAKTAVPREPKARTSNGQSTRATP